MKILLSNIFLLSLLMLFQGCDHVGIRLRKCNSDLECSTVAVFEKMSQCEETRHEMEGKFPFAYFCEAP